MVPRFNTAVELLEFAFKNYPQNRAYTCAGHTLTFDEIEKLSAEFAYYLQNVLNLEPGDRIAMQLPNVLQYPVALYGAIRAGLVVVNTNPLYTAPEIEHQLNDSGAKALVVLSNIAANAASIIKNTKVEHVIVTNFADLHPAPKRWIINAVVKHVKKMVPKFHFESQHAFRAAVGHGKTSFTKHAKTSDDLLVLQYTGGTTGVAKGAMLTHGNLTSNVWQMIEHMPNAYVPGKETFLACLPLYHIYAFNLHALSAFCYGEHNILIPNPRDLQSLVDAIKNEDLTVMIGINTLFNALCRFEPFLALNFDRLKITSSGGMALTMDAAHTWEKITGCKVVEGYGLTEASPVVSGNPSDAIQLGTIGVPLPETQVKIVDDVGNELPQGETGELCVKGPQVMPGYWNKPEETKKVLSDGWLRTGDMALIQADGYLKIVDRKKDLIIVSGFNVYPNEVEDVITQHPAVIEAAAVGMADAESGERVKVFAVVSDTNVTERELVDFCKKSLTGYKVPKKIVFREALPKTNVGKILRRELRDE
ncbi:AMP-binding protein [Saccharophagus degradans]|uniref:Long-chain-fatty-acid--CoA ligase n=1 Tax=Saccharophagus degradans TaxID=86304 RepID=A0AAW7X1H4_9GAMM|nr:AMP-binding protein [Saccharophagus degradans]MDO6421300.1 AMP-binding protein [Saccharophagus degradans]MDO6605789.1 AMP-binding protein [Saccharophagus degradans]